MKSLQISGSQTCRVLTTESSVRRHRQCWRWNEWHGGPPHEPRHLSPKMFQQQKPSIKRSTPGILRKLSCVPIYSIYFQIYHIYIGSCMKLPDLWSWLSWWVDDLVIGFTKCHPAALTLKGRMHLRDDRFGYCIFDSYDYMTVLMTRFLLEPIRQICDSSCIWRTFQETTLASLQISKKRGWSMQQPLVAGLKHVYLCLNLSQRLSLTDSTKWQRHASFLRSTVSIHMFSWMSLWSSCDLMWVCCRVSNSVELIWDFCARVRDYH